jgi:hypothetical protein
VDQNLRAAVARGLHVDNLWVILGVCTDLLRAGQVSNPIIPLTIKAVCSDLASKQEGEAVPADYAELVDAHVLPVIEELLNVSSGSADQVRDALNYLARVYADTLLRR